MNTTASENFTQEISLPLQHALRITKLGVKLLVSFRVLQKEIPSWLPRHHTKDESVASKQAQGKPLRFKIDNVEQDLHSVKHDLTKFAQFHLANAYWDFVETQKGARPVVYFWFHDSAENVNPDELLRAKASEFFATITMKTWDYVNVYVNPDNSLAIVYKGGSQKPVRHLLSVQQK